MEQQICHLACPGVPWDWSAAEWRDLRFPFRFSRRLFNPYTNPSPSSAL
jgi:hypothetical protein